ncbi:hypothetical protein M513_10934, partial [Trichuris suis]
MPYMSPPGAARQQMPNGAPQRRCTNSACRARISARTGTWFPKPVELTEGHRPYPGLERQDEHLNECNSGQGGTEDQEQRTEMNNGNTGGLDSGTAVNWNRHLRAVAAQAVGEVSHPIGGPSNTVDLDETLFCPRKYNRGRHYGRRQWVFGGTCRETGESFLEL